TQAPVAVPHRAEHRGVEVRILVVESDVVEEQGLGAGRRHADGARQKQHEKCPCSKTVHTQPLGPLSSRPQSTATERTRPLTGVDRRCWWPWREQLPQGWR